MFDLKIQLAHHVQGRLCCPMLPEQGTPALQHSTAASALSAGMTLTCAFNRGTIFFREPEGIRKEKWGKHPSEALT